VNGTERENEDIICSSSTLSVQLTSFNGECNKSQQKLSWSTASEINNDYFTIEGSLDGIEFYTLDRITGAGNKNTQTNYNWTDYTISNLTSRYYRLKQNDFDGIYTYSPIIFNNCKKTKGDILIYPNPFSKELNIVLSQESNSEETVILIYDHLGRLVYEKLKKNTQNINIKIPDQLPNGIYTLKINTDFSSYSKKLFKQ